MSEHAPIPRMRDIEKHFGNVIALAGVSVDVYPGECHCLPGDNGAGNSTFIKAMSGVHKPTKGEILFRGKPMDFANPRDAMEAGIATVYEDLADDPAHVGDAQLLHGARADRGTRKRFDTETASRVTMEEMRRASTCARTRRSARCRAASARPWPSHERSFSGRRC